MMNLLVVNVNSGQIILGSPDRASSPSQNLITGFILGYVYICLLLTRRAFWPYQRISRRLPRMITTFMSGYFLVGAGLIANIPRSAIDMLQAAQPLRMRPRVIAVPLEIMQPMTSRVTVLANVAFADARHAVCWMFLTELMHPVCACDVTRPDPE
jgi:multisubunit Na+/H+ antiporter MnhE subunit